MPVILATYGWEHSPYRYSLETYIGMIVVSVKVVFENLEILAVIHYGYTVSVECTRNILKFQ